MIVLRKKGSKEVEMHELANIIREYSWIPNRRIPLLISFEKLNKATISALEDAKVDVCEVMPDLKMVYAEIMPKPSILDKLRKIQSITQISISREVEVHDS
jgi:hypothetical protein